MQQTVVARPASEKVLTWVGFPVGCALLGWALRALLGWLVSLPWAPLQGPLRLLQSIGEPWVTLILVALGLVVGLLLGATAADESITVTVTDSEVTVADGERTARRVAAAAVHAACRPGKDLVIFGDRGTELARVRTDLGASRLRDAFTAHGYRWLDEDPHREEFQRWVAGSRHLGAEAHALLSARERAMHGDKKADADQLRDELAEIDVVVRDERKQQYWRRSG